MWEAGGVTGEGVTGGGVTGTPRLTRGHSQLAGGPAGLGLGQVTHRGAAGDVHLGTGSGTQQGWGPPQEGAVTPPKKKSGALIAVVELGEEDAALPP